MMRNGSNISYACYGKALRKENQKELDAEKVAKKKKRLKKKNAMKKKQRVKSDEL